MRYRLLARLRWLATMPMCLLLHLPGQDVAGPVIVTVRCAGQGLAMALEKGGQVEDPPVVDIAVGTPQSPVVRIGAEMAPHVFVHQHLQIDVQLPVGANDDIGAHAAQRGHVAAGIPDLHIGRVIGDVRIDDIFRGIGQPFRKGLWRRALPLPHLRRNIFRYIGQSFRQGLRRCRSLVPQLRRHDEYPDAAAQYDPEPVPVAKSWHARAPFSDP